MSARRIVAFGGAAVAIDSRGERAEHLVRFACRHVPSTSDLADGVSRPPEVVDVDSEAGSLTLSTSTGPILTTDDDGALVKHLMHAVTFGLVGPSPTGALIHGALLSCDGGRSALLLPGRSGVGKSTLAAWLVARGLALATDELVHVPLGSFTASGFTRPIHLKRRVTAITRALVSEDPTLRLSCDDGELLHPEALGGQPETGCVPIGAIVFPAFSAQGVEGIGKLAHASATRMLFSLFANARDLPGHGLTEAARLARQIPAYQLEHRSAERAEELLGLVGLLDPRLDPRREA